MAQSGGSASSSSSGGRRIFWSHTSNDRFLVASSNELRLLEYTPDVAANAKHGTSGRAQKRAFKDGNPLYRTVAVTSDLPGFKAVAWSPDPNLPDLTALGLLTGRVILLRMHDVPVYTSSPHPSILHLNVRHPRPCNAVAFSHVEPGLLATGYDKVRDNSLLVWDVRDAFRNSSSGGSGHTPGHNARSHRGSSSASEANMGRTAGSTAGSATSPAEPRPIAQFGLSEQVSAATWLYHTPRTLVAAMALKWIRVYDLRSPSSSSSSSASAANNAVTVMNGRNVTALHADPYDAHRFASLSADEGVVRLWDLRHASEPLLTFSSEDGVHSPALLQQQPQEQSSKATKPSKTSRISFAAGPSSASLSSIATAATLQAQSNSNNNNVGGTGGSVVSMAFSRSRRGELATMDRDTHQVSAWNIFEIGSGRPAAAAEQRQEDDPESGGGALMLQTAEDIEEQAPTPTLYYERKTGNTSKPLNSFAFVPSGAGGSGGPQRFVTVNREGAIEFCEIKASPQLAFDRSGQFGYAWEGRFSVQGSNLAPPPDPRLFGNTLAGSVALYQKEGQDTDKRNSRQSSAYSASQERLISTIRNLGSRQASPSRGEKSAHKSRAQTRTRTRTRSSKTGGEDTDEYSYEEEEEEGVTEGEVTEGEEQPLRRRSLQCRIPLLEKDISVTMRKRATDGYGLDPVKNRRLVRESSKSGVGGNAAGAEQLWSWVEHAATMSSGGRAFVDGFDFGFRGVLPILKGFSAYNAQHPSSASLHPTTSGGGQAGKSSATTNNNTFHSKRSRTVSQPTTSGTGSGSGVLEDVKHSLSKGESVRALEAAFTRACVSMNKKNGSASFPSISGSAKPSQRQLALTSLGPDFASGDVAAVIRRYESHGQPSKAAAWALFSGNVELAIRSLKNNRDERLKLLAPILATHLAQRDQAGTSAFKELCSGLSTSLDDPFMRAIFAYLASGDWTDVLEEDALPLKDRIGVALRFLPDDELYRNLDRMAQKATAAGELEGLLLTGLLDNSGFSLLQSYVDRTGDVQTAALAGSFVHPGQVHDVRVERWIEAYRGILDHWRMYTVRARFDIARGSKMRSSLAVKGSEENSAAIGALLAPPHMLIRCHFCNETIAPKTHHGQQGSQVNLAKRRQQSVQSLPSRTTRCPNCSKSFPRCSICLMSIEVSTTGSDTLPSWCWCQRCRHGGHASHVLEWFRRGNDECPVADCECNCRGDSGLN